MAPHQHRYLEIVRTQKPKLLIFMCLLPIAQSFAFTPSWSSLSSTKSRTAQRAFLHLPSSSNERSDSNIGSLLVSGERIIMQAAIKVGASPDQVDIQWSGSRIIVTIKEKATISTDYDVQDQHLLEFISEEEEEEEDVPMKNEIESDYFENTCLSSEGIDIYAVSRSINEALRDSGELGEYISINYDIEVTTPGISDVLPENVINSYKGFDVLVDTYDKKAGKKQTIQGILVERGKETTTLNIKGRTRKLKNNEIECTRLPKPKK